MKSNSQVRRERPDIKATPGSELPGSRRKAFTVDEASPREVINYINDFPSGVVVDCLRLDIRKTPSSDGEVVDVIGCLTDVVVDLGFSTDEFYRIITPTGVEGFCIKKYIAIRR